MHWTSVPHISQQIKKFNPIISPYADCSSSPVGMRCSKISVRDEQFQLQHEEDQRMFIEEEELRWEWKIGCSET